MARNNRQKSLRKFENVKGNIEKAMQHLNEIGEIYAEQYPKHTKWIAECVLCCKMAYDVVTRVKDQF